MASNASLGVITNNKEAWRESIMFKNLKAPKDLSKYSLLRGAPDFAQVGMWDEFESGYAYLVVVQIPKFLEILAEKDTATYAPWINTCRRTLEYEFKNQLNRISSVRDIVDIDPIEIEIRTKEDKYTPISIQWPEGTIQQHRKYLLEENPAKKKKR